MQQNPKNPEKEALIQEMLRQMRQQLEDKLPNDTATLDQIEETVEEIGTSLQQELQKRITKQRAQKPRENRLACSCGEVASYKDMQTRTLQTRHGALPLRRAWYYCRQCKRGFSPLDTDLALDDSEVSGCLRQWSAHLSARLPFEEATHTLLRLTAVRLSPATLERLACAVGHNLQTATFAQASKHHKGQLPDQKTACPRRLYVSVDGVFVPLREAWKRDATLGKLHCRYGECKVGVVFETGQDKEGKDSRVLWQDYVATFADVEAFTPLIGALAHENGHHAAREVVFLSDGATWIRQLAGREFPTAVQIVDFFHACGHLAAVAEARFGMDTPESRAWQEARQQELKTNRLDLVLQAIGSWHPTHAAKRELRRREYGYFFNNAERMRYQTYLEHGYHIGSGVVEATCKRVVAQRLDQAGMHWRQETAEAIVALRAAELSSHSPDLRPHCRMAA